MKTRLFIAVNLSDELKGYLFDLQKELNLDAKIKWVAKKNLHITLKFLGWVEDADKTIEMLKNVKFEPFEFRLKSLEVFDRSRPRVLLVDVEPVTGIMELWDRVENSLRGLFERDNKFSAHITIGRIKLYKNKNEILEKINLFKVENLKEKVDSFCLVESLLKKDGPMYKIVVEFKAVK